VAQQYNAPMPPVQVLAPGYTLRITALDPSTGSLVSGAKVGTVVIDAEVEAAGSSDGGIVYGDWALVPGPGA